MPEEKPSKEVHEAVQNMTGFVNKYGVDLPGFVEEMSRQHRTLQASFTGVCFAWIKKCAEMHRDGNFDLRNQYPVEKCVEITNKVELHRPPLI